MFINESESFPFNCAGRFVGDIIHNTIDLALQRVRYLGAD